VNPRAPVGEDQRTVARLNALYAIRDGQVTGTQAPSHVWPGAIAEVLELGLASDAELPYQLTTRGAIFLEAIRHHPGGNDDAT
jgi:hypothetical protein